MQMDAITLAAVADEFSRTLVGSRVEDAIQPTPRSIALLCYGGGRKSWLVASAHQQFAGVHLTASRPRKLAVEPPPFVMLLRKHLDGARVAELRQPRWERVLEIGFTTSPQKDPTVWLIIEAMGRLSNIILTDGDGMILGALHGVSASVNRYRTITPNIPYRYPPPQTRTLHGQTVPRLDPESVTAEALREAAADSSRSESDGKTSTSLVGFLAEQLAGFGRDLSAEAVWRTFGKRDVTLHSDLPWEALAGHCQSLASVAARHAWQPTLVFASGSERPTAFAVYRPQRFPDAHLEEQTGVAAMLATYFGDAEWRDALDSAKSGLRRQLQTVAERARRKAEILASELEGLQEARRLRLEGDLLLAFQHDIPIGARTFTTQNPFATDGEQEQLTLTLDPRLTAVDNANRRFDRYHKMQRAAQKIPEQIAVNDVELARVSQLLTDLDLAESPAEVAQVRDAVAASGALRSDDIQRGDQKRGKGKDQRGKVGKGTKGQKKAGSPGGAPLRLKLEDGITVLVGKNSLQNEAVTFREASPNDIWLHARGVPGAHVIVKSGGRPLSEEALRRAAAIAAYFSHSRAAGSVPVDFTAQRYVRHMKGGGPGMVVYEGERTLHVAPEEPDGM